MLNQLAHTIITRLLDWFTRTRSIGVTLLTSGIGLVIATLGTDFVVQVSRQAKDDGWSFSFGTGQGLPFWLTLLFAGAGLLLVVIGTIVLVAEHRRERRRRLVVIEMRGLHTSPDTPAVDQVVTAFRGNRYHLLLDFRPQGQDARVDPGNLLERVSSMKGALQSLVDGADKRDVQVAIGGLAAVPALFLAGILIDDESLVHLYDWDRSAKCWRAIDGADDSVRFLPIEGLPSTGAISEAVLVVEASYPVNQADVAASFASSLPVVRLRVETPLADRFWSEQKQAALVVQFRDAVQHLSSIGVRRLHLVVAAPASLSIRLGMCYDRRLFPDVIVYQFEKALSKPYPWGLQMPTVGNTARIVLV
ncbi:SAVED domain-containing protein [Aeromonas veronii]|uniref:SAVED domain-containing protein n=1 Tax=Aeromonas veronii TaxID=654 RepID=UPI00191CBA01|nr:SAVED domain-containing protein [Aeromonas veronii]MBL0492944.1 SAVED domain-containing protein [Aeromonas veronii]